MSKMYSKPGYGNEKILYDGNGKVIGRGVTDKNGKTIYSGAGGYVGKSYTTSVGTVKHFDSNNNFVGTGINRSGFSTIVCNDLEKAPTYGSTNYNFSGGQSPVSQTAVTKKIPRECFEFQGESRKVPTYVTLKPEAMRKMYTDIPYAILEESWENEQGQIVCKYRFLNRMGYWNFHETIKSPDETISELNIDYHKANISHLMKFPHEDRDFHLTMYDSVINNRPPEYYLKKLRRRKIENALGYISLGALALLILILIFS